MESYEDTVLNAVAEKLSEVEGIQQSAYLLSNATAPAIEALPGPIEYSETFGAGTHHFTATIRVTVGTALNTAAQKKLREYRAPIGEKSIKALLDEFRLEQLEADEPLIADLNVNSCSAARLFRRPGGEVVYGCDFEVEFEGTGELPS